MTLSPRKVVTVVAEAALESRLVSDLQKLGVPGYTVSPAHGAGVRGQREGDIEGGNIRVETVVKDDLADAVLQHLQIHYFPHYACVAWVSDAAIVRGERF